PPWRPPGAIAMPEPRTARVISVNADGTIEVGQPASGPWIEGTRLKISDESGRAVAEVKVVRADPGSAVARYFAPWNSSAVTGGVIGSLILPGVGTVIGAAIGGLVGASGSGKGRPSSIREGMTAAEIVDDGPGTTDAQQDPGTHSALG